MLFRTFDLPCPLLLAALLAGSACDGSVDSRDGGRSDASSTDGGDRDGGDRDGGHRDGGHRDGGHRDGGHRDGGPPEPAYRVLAGDCLLLWLATTPATPAPYRDVDGDGRRDVITFQRDRITLLAGRDGAWLGDVTAPVLPERHDVRIVDVRPVPDVTGDGLEDLAVRQEYFTVMVSDPDGGVVSPPPAGTRGHALTLLSGADGALFWQRLHDPSSGVDGQMSHTPEPAPDLDGDGAPEILLGRGSEPLTTTPGHGQLLVLSGRTGAILASHDAPPEVYGFPGDVFLLESDPPAVAAQARPDHVPDRHVVMGLPLGATTPSWTYADMAFDMSNARATLDMTGDDVPDVIVNHRERSVGENLFGEVVALDGQSGAVLWGTPSRTVFFGRFGFGLATASDADGDGVGEVAAGTAQSPPMPTLNAPGLFAILSGADGSYLAEVMHDEFPEDAICDFGRDIAAFDDPTDRGGAAVAVTHHHTGRPALLTAWSCLP